MTDPVLNFQDLHKQFDQHPVLRGISTAVGAGEVIGLVGLNGAGKTTLLETALGFNPPSAGSVEVFGVAGAELGGRAERSRIGFVPQQDELLTSLSGQRYLNLLATFYPNWDHELVRRLCEEWQVPLNQDIKKLSVGQRQKLSIISALAYNPDLIVLDEPVASLDPVARRQFLGELVALAHDRQCTIIFSTHIVSDLERVADRLWLLKDGQLVIDEPLDRLKERIVKITLPAGVDAPLELLSEHSLHRHQSDTDHSWIVGDWSDALAAQLSQSVGELDAQWTLSLEDIFLEVHA